MKIWLFAGMLLAAGFAGPVMAAERCDFAMETRADAALDELKSWQQLYSFYQSYAVCDDGEVAEGVSDAVEKLMTGHWRNVTAIRTPLQNDPVFRAFVLRHVDELWSQEETAIARKNATDHCPDGMADFCLAVIDAANWN